MLFHSVKNNVLGLVAGLKSEYYKKEVPVTLNLDRFERNVRRSYDLSSLFSVLRQNHYTWGWFVSALAEPLDLSHNDVYDLARACADHPALVKSSDYHECDDEDC